MKKILLVVALLMGGAAITTNTVQAENASQVCDMSRPCVYTGPAKAEASSDEINIQVYYAKDYDNFVAVINNDTNNVQFVLYDESKGKSYVNYKGKKYFFKM